MEYADDGDLQHKITQHQEKSTTFDEKQIWSIMIQIIKGLKALHKANVLHRDLKVVRLLLRAPMCFFLRMGKSSSAI